MQLGGEDRWLPVTKKRNQHNQTNNKELRGMKNEFSGCNYEIREVLGAERMRSGSAL